MLAQLLVAGVLLAGGERDQTPDRVYRPVAVIAEKTVRFTEFDEFQMLPCEHSGKEEWACPVVYDGWATATYRVGPSLIRKRRNGHWVGPWRHTGHLGVTGLISATGTR